MLLDKRAEKVPGIEDGAGSLSPTILGIAIEYALNGLTGKRR